MFRQLVIVYYNLLVCIHVVHCLKVVLAWCFVIGLGTCCSRVAIVFMYPVCAIDKSSLSMCFLCVVV